MLALVAAGVSLVLHWAVEPFFQPDRGLIVFIPAIILVTLVAGPRFGTLTAAVLGIAVWYNMLLVRDFKLSHIDAVSLCIYVGSSAIAIVIVYWLRESQAQERLLGKELQHRTKNLLALVHSLAYQTLRGDAAMDEARSAFISRLTALNRANETMGDSGLDQVDLILLIRSVLKAFSDRFECHGEEVCLNSMTARNLTLALHELATNSTKYGALSVPSGSVRLNWQTDNPARQLEFSWRECGGPPVSPPTSVGFGSKLLQSLFDNGDVQFAPDGLVYRVQIPLYA